MASGFGLTGGPSRCFPYWQEVLACYVVNTNSEEPTGKRKCVPVLEDYYECLHHKKEIRRTEVLQAAYRKAEQEKSQENVPTADEIRGLGLLKASPEEKNLKHGSLLPFKSRN